MVVGIALLGEGTGVYKYNVYKYSQCTLTNWLESCGGCCTAQKLCSDLSHISTMQSYDLAWRLAGAMSLTLCPC